MPELCGVVGLVVSLMHADIQHAQSEKGLASAAGRSTGMAGLVFSGALLGLNEELQEELDSTAWGRAISGE